MIYSPHSLLKLVRDGKLIKHLAHRELTTPEGVGFDLRLAGLSRLTVGGGSLRESTRRTPASEVVLADPDDCFVMEPGKTYLASTMEEFDLPEDLAALFSEKHAVQKRDNVQFQCAASRLCRADDVRAHQQSQRGV